MSQAPTRLRRSREIRDVLRRGRHAAGDLLSLHVRTADGGDTAAAVVASRRVGQAVERNRAKRLMREAARRVPWRPGLHVVMVARAACADSGRGAVQSELEGLAARLRALRDAQDPRDAHV